MGNEDIKQVKGYHLLSRSAVIPLVNRVTGEEYVINNDHMFGILRQFEFLVHDGELIPFSEGVLETPQPLKSKRKLRINP